MLHYYINIISYSQKIEIIYISHVLQEGMPREVTNRQNSSGRYQSDLDEELMPSHMLVCFNIYILNGSSSYSSYYIILHYL